jgi:tetratricopeptide (TPR) repeat protein
MAGAASVAMLQGAVGSERKPPELDALLDTGRQEEAKALVRRLKSPVEQRSWRAKMAFYAGDYAAAFAEMATLEKGSVPGRSWQDLQNYFGALQDIWKGGVETDSAHFRMRTTGIDAILAAAALEALEKAYEEIGRDLYCHPDEKVLVEVYGDKASFSLASTLSEETLEKSGTVGICKFNRLMLLSPQCLPLGYRWLDTLAHEYTHLLVNRKSGGRCPLWLHEGIARYHETRWRLGTPEFLSAAGKDRLGEAMKRSALVSFKKMHPSLVYLKDQDEIALAFSEVATAVQFLKARSGAAKLAALLSDMEYLDEKAAFRHTLGITPEQFEKKWKSYLNTLGLKPSPGALPDRVRFEALDEEACVGADQRGLLRLGDQMRAIGRPEAAIIHYEKALAAEPSNPIILLKLARAALAREDMAKAETCLKTAIEKNPGYVTPYQVLGELYFKQQEHEKAILVLREAVAINPFHPQTHYCLSRSYLATGDYPNARTELQIVTLLDPEDGESRVMFEQFQQQQ